jgi:hypothetical protein
MICSEGGNNLIVKHGIAPERDARGPTGEMPRIWGSTANRYLGNGGLAVGQGLDHPPHGLTRPILRNTLAIEAQEIVANGVFTPCSHGRNGGDRPRQQLVETVVRMYK